MAQPVGPALGPHVQNLPPAPPDPAHDRCPDWSSGFAKEYVDSLIPELRNAAGEVTRPARSLDEAVKHATEKWNLEHAEKQKAWDTWVSLRTEAEKKDTAEAAALADEEAQREQEEKERVMARREREAAEALEAARLQGLKKAAEHELELFEVPIGVAPSSLLALHPCQYAVNLITAKRNCPLEYFLPDYIRRQGQKRATSGIDDSDIATPVIHNGSLALLPTGAPKSDVRVNSALAWNEVTAAFPILVETMTRSGKYSKSACEQMFRLPTILANTAEFRGTTNDRTCVLYVSQIFDKFFSTWRNYKPFSPHTCEPLFDVAEINVGLWNRLANEERGNAQNLAT
jgi:hypothetical protein